MTEYTRVTVELPTSLVAQIRGLVGPGDEGFAFVVESALRLQLEEDARPKPPLSDEEVQKLVDEAVAEVRRERAPMHV